MGYSNDYKIKLCKLICDEGKPITEVSKEFNMSRYTLQRWLRSYRLNPNCFNRTHVDPDFLTDNIDDEIKYLNMTEIELRNELMKKDIEIARLKKGYTVKGVGAKKEYVSFSKKNTK